MTATKDLENALYGAQDTWRARRKPGPKDTMVRDMVAFVTHAARHKPTTKTAKAQVARIARRVPQAMVKVSKGTFGVKHTLANFTYISRNGKVPLYDQDGRAITDVDEMETLAAEWHALNFSPDDLDTRVSSPDARRIILSMPKGTDPGKVLSAARATARHLFTDRYDYVLGMHLEEGKAEHPHVHLTVRARSHDGEPLEFRREDLHYMRRAFAVELRQRGVEADATPQTARGPRLNNEHIKVHKARRAVEDANSLQGKPSAKFQRDYDRMRSGTDRQHFDDTTVDIYAAIVRGLRGSEDSSDRRLASEFDSYLASSFGARYRDKVDVGLRPEVRQEPKPPKPRL